MPTATPTPSDPTSRSAWRLAGRCLAWAAAIAVLGLVFLLYFNSQLVFDLATRIWSCF